MIMNLPESFRINATAGDYERYLDTEDRRLYLTQEIAAFDPDTTDGDMSLCSYFVDAILAFNRADKGLAPEERRPIRLYINSPGGTSTKVTL